MPGLYEHLEGELDAAGFFYPPEKTPVDGAQSARRLRPRPLSDQEVRTLRGVITALTKGRGRVLAKLAAKKAPGEAEKNCARSAKVVIHGVSRAPASRNPSTRRLTGDR